MSGFDRVALTVVAVLIGVSPLLWVTADEFMIARDALVRFDRTVLVDTAKEMMERGAIEEAAEFVREARERHPDDEGMGPRLSRYLCSNASGVL